MPWEWGDPGGVAVSEQPELADNRKGKTVGGRRKEEAVSFFNPGMTNRADGVLTSCTGVLGSSRRTNDAGRDPVGIMRLDGRVRLESSIIV